MSGFSHSPSPSIFNFKEEITLKDFLGNFDTGIDSYNNQINNMKLKQQEFNDNSLKIKEKINTKYKQDTYTRGSELLSKKIEFYNYWIEILYTIHKITMVILCIIVVVMLIYKLMNKK